MSNPKGTKIGRNAITGRLETVKQAQKHPRTSVVETMPRKSSAKPKGRR